MAVVVVVVVVVVDVVVVEVVLGPSAMTDINIYRRIMLRGRGVKTTSLASWMNC